MANWSAERWRWSELNLKLSLRELKKSERYSCHVLKLISTLLFLPFQIKNLLGTSISRIFTIFSTYFFALSIPCSYAKLHSASNKAHTWVLYGVGIYDAWEISLCFKCENFFSERIMVGGIKENYFKISNQTASHVRSIFQLIHLHVTFCMLVKKIPHAKSYAIKNKINDFSFSHPIGPRQASTTSSRWHCRGAEAIQRASQVKNCRASNRQRSFEGSTLLLGHRYKWVNLLNFHPHLP